MPQTSASGVFWQADEEEKFRNCNSHSNWPFILKTHLLWALFIQQLSLIAK